MKGRPQKKVKRDRSLHMRLTEQEYKQLRFMADKCDCTMTEIAIALIHYTFYDGSLPELKEIVADYKAERRNEH